MFTLSILLLVLTTTPARAAQSASPRVVVQSQSRPQPESQDEGRESVEAETGDKAVFKFEGLRAFAEKDVRKALREGHINVDEPFVHDPARIEKAARSVKKHLTSEGYLRATVDVREDRMVNPYVITLAVDEGEPARIEEIRFEGSRKVPAARLSDEVRGCLDRFADKEEERGLFKPAHVDYCMRVAARGFLGKEGYLRAEVGKYSVEETESGVRISASVKEGLRYRLGKIKVKGATVFLPEQIVEMLGVQTGDVLDNAKVGEFLFERLRGEYGQRGYIQYEADIEPAYKSPAAGKRHGTVDLKVNIFEGKSFTISSLSFVGNRLKTVGELKSELSLREGDVFDRRRLHEGLARLVRLGVYRGNADPDAINEAGVEINLDNEKGLAALRIHIVETNPR